MVRSGLRHIIEAQPNWQVVAEAGDGKEAVQKALETKPDVAVIDYSLPILDGAEATRQIRAALPQTEALSFTMHDNETLMLSAAPLLAMDANPASACGRGYGYGYGAYRYAAYRPVYSYRRAYAYRPVYAYAGFYRPRVWGWGGWGWRRGWRRW